MITILPPESSLTTLGIPRGTVFYGRLLSPTHGWSSRRLWLHLGTFNRDFFTPYTICLEPGVPGYPDPNAHSYYNESVQVSDYEPVDIEITVKR
jgi:hypothetical protein